MAWSRNYYTNEARDVSWMDEWSCACNDRCAKCDAEIELQDREEGGNLGVASGAPVDTSNLLENNSIYFLD